MKPFRSVSGRMAPLYVANVDTDVIIRVDVRSSSPEVLGPHAFEAWRYHPDGSENCDFVLNQSPYRGAPVLLTGANFGCGSSRERAVWALQGIGIRCVIGPSFGEIFEANCYQNGVLPIRLESECVEKLVHEANSHASIQVDLAKNRISTSRGTIVEFAIDATRRERLLEGLDDIGMTCKEFPAIEAWQMEDKIQRPWVWSIGGR